MKLFTSTQAAAQIGVDASTIRRWCREKRIPGAVHYGRDWMMPAASLDGVTKQKPGRKKVE